ncbi:hypothetical protein [Streptomyces erythrochromogenes]|uniref:hypothetical protein n=1 Tax=Streptomyces erythrochromogenes TaxID=285574 RepID=UPI003413D6E4
MVDRQAAVVVTADEQAVAGVVLVVGGGSDDGQRLELGDRLRMRVEVRSNQRRQAGYEFLLGGPSIVENRDQSIPLSRGASMYKLADLQCNPSRAACDRSTDQRDGRSGRNLSNNIGQAQGR